MNTVYWIRHPEMKYHMTQGYIGISNDPKRRFQQHKGKDWYDDRCVLTILQDGLTREEAVKIEEILRPKWNIGWNIVPGGGDPPRHGKGNPNMKGNHHRKGKKDSAETRAKKSKSNGRYKRTDEWIQSVAMKNLNYLRAKISCLDCRKVVGGKNALREHLKKHGSK